MLGMVRNSGLKLGLRDFGLLVTGKVHCLERWRGIIEQGDRGKGRKMCGKHVVGTWENSNNLLHL